VCIRLLTAGRDMRKHDRSTDLQGVCSNVDQHLNGEAIICWRNQRWNAVSPDVGIRKNQDGEAFDLDNNARRNKKRSKLQHLV